MLEPHINYTNHVLSSIDSGINIKGIAHITGGGLIENIPRVLPPGLGADIKRRFLAYSSDFKLIQSLGKVEKDEMYKTFNMGVGMVLLLIQRPKLFNKPSFTVFKTLFNR